MILLILIQGVFADWYHNSKAFTLTAQNHEQYLGQEQHVILDFFTPWCVYCQQMLGEFNRVYEHYEQQRNDILISKMNCDEHHNRHICQKFGVTGFPTIMYFPPHGQRPTSIFQNYRTFDHFVQWIDSVAVKSQEQLKKEELILQEKELQEKLERERQEVNQIEQERKDDELQQMISQLQMQLVEKDIALQKIEHMNMELDKMNEAIADLNTKVSFYKQQNKVNLNHVIVFTSFGLMMGILTTSCICFVQRKGEFRKVVMNSTPH